MIDRMACNASTAISNTNTFDRPSLAVEVERPAWPFTCVRTTRRGSAAPRARERGQQPRAFAAPIRNPQNSKAGVGLLRRSDVRCAGSATQLLASASRHVSESRRARNPRRARLSGAASRHLLRKSTGFRITAVDAGRAFPAFMRTRYSWSVVPMTERANDGTRPAGGESQVWTAAATDTCSGLEALLLQSLFAGASDRDALAPAGRPDQQPGRTRR